jgi:hypothetical protein
MIAPENGQIICRLEVFANFRFGTRVQISCHLDYA